MKTETPGPCPGAFESVGLGRGLGISSLTGSQGRARSETSGAGERRRGPSFLLSPERSTSDPILYFPPSRHPQP